MSLLSIDERGGGCGEWTLGCGVVSFGALVLLEVVLRLFLMLLLCCLLLLLCCCALVGAVEDLFLLLSLRCDEDSSFFSIDSFNLAKSRRHCFAASSLAIL